MSFHDHKDFWTEFIGLYRRMECLWNSKSKDYNNKQARKNAFHILVDKCKDVFPQADIEFVRKKVDNLRSSFRREYRKVEKSKYSSGSYEEPIYEPVLWYYDLLMFTVDNERNQSGVSSLCSPVMDDRDAEVDEETEDSQIFQFQTLNDNHELAGYKQRRSQVADSVSKKYRCLEFLGNAAEEGDQDSAYIYGVNVGCQLKEMDVHQRIIAEKVISEVIFHGKLGNLTYQSGVSLNSQPYESYNSSQNILTNFKVDNSEET